MTISRSQYLITDFAEDFKNGYSVSATIATGQLCVVSIAYRNLSEWRFSTPSWNGQTFSSLGSVVVHPNTISQTWYLIADSSATDNIVATADGYVGLNLMFAVYSTTVGWATPTIISQFFDSGDYLSPSINVNLSANKKSITVFNGLGWNSGFGATTLPWTTNAPIIAVEDINNTTFQNVYRMYFGEADGTTTQALSYTPTDGEEPMWVYNAIVLEESATQVISFNGNENIYNGQTQIDFEVAEFTDNEVVEITASFEGITLSNIVNFGDGTGTVDISDMVNGGKYPVLPAVITFTFKDIDNNVASITKNLVLQSSWSQVTYVNAIPYTNRMFCWHPYNSGISIANDTRVMWPTTEDFYCTENGDTYSLVERTITILVNSQGSTDPNDDNKISEWVFTINEAGVIPTDILLNEMRAISGIFKSGYAPSAEHNYLPLKNVVFRNQNINTAPPVFNYGAVVTDDISGVHESKCIKILTYPSQPGVSCGSPDFAGRFELPEVVPLGKTVWFRVKLFFPSSFSFGYTYGIGAASSPATDGCGVSADGNPTGIKGLVFEPDNTTSRSYFNWSNSVRTIGQAPGTGVIALEPDAEKQTGLFYSFPRDRWHTQEFAIHVSNTGTGWARVWVDGVLEGEIITADTVTSTDTGIKHVGIGSYFNGTPWTDGAAGRDTFYVDEILVAADIDGYGAPDAIDADGNVMIGVSVQNRDFINGY